MKKNVEEARPLGCMGYMSEKNRLYSVAFTCSNCGKYHVDIIFGTRVKCECGSVIDLTLTGRESNEA